MISDQRPTHSVHTTNTTAATPGHWPDLCVRHGGAIDADDNP